VNGLTSDFQATTDRADLEPSAVGVLPSQELQRAMVDGWITSSLPSWAPTALQPASIDLTLGTKAWQLRCSFLPDSKSTVTEKVADIAFGEIDLTDGVVLERDRPYLIALNESLKLPPGIRAKANPKSSTGRLDVFTRVITDRNHRFDEIGDGYTGRLFLEVVPRSFAVRVQTGLALNQLRLIRGRDIRLSDQDLLKLHAESPLLYADSHPLRETEISTGDGVFLGLNVAANTETIVGFKARKNSHPIDLSKIRHYAWRDYWEPVYPESKRRIVLEPEAFYLLLSAEGVCIPPGVAAEMMAYDPTAGELRTHYAGFFDPGFGYDPSGRRPGSRAALEVRARDVSFMVEHEQPVCKLAFEQMAGPPALLYGAELGSNYQGQESMLSKHFADQTAGVSQMALPVLEPTSTPLGGLFEALDGQD
jgi:dCTP deaminase